MENAKFNYNNAELFISKFNIYGSKYFLLVDIENKTCFEGWEDFYTEDMEKGSDGYLYCFNCIHDHLEDEEDELEDIA